MRFERGESYRLKTWLLIAALLGACGGDGNDTKKSGIMQPPPGAAAGAAGSTVASAPAPIAGTPAAPVAGVTAPPPAGSGGAGGTAVPAGAGGMGGMPMGGSAGSVVGGTGGAPDAGMPDAGMGSDSSAQLLPAVTDYTKDGPFKTKTEANVGPSNNYTVFRPDPLGENGFLHSPVIFGPGILTTASNYRTLLLHLASHGFAIICVNSMSGGPNDPGNLAAMKDGLDWLIAQNDMAGPYQGKLAVDRAVTMGYSIGATASTQLSSHEAIMTTISIHGHNTMGDPHGPILLLTGTNDVIDDNRTTLKTLDEAPAMLAALPIGHLDVLTEISATGRYIAPITAWLRYWVNGDQDAKHFFWGDGCDMCKSPWITPETNDEWKAQKL
jgi:hypothetical protein